MPTHLSHPDHTLSDVSKGLLNTLMDKHETLGEERIWRIFLQLVLACQYLHQEKRVVHRDLTSSNIIIGTNDVVRSGYQGEKLFLFPRQSWQTLDWLASKELKA